ncbi:MAG: stress response translation initiation inhibitor YciH [Dehalococcoidia bacterium]
MSDGSRLVYSTDGGRVRPAPAPRRTAAQPAAPDPGDGVVRLRREKGGRGGKTITSVTGLPGSPAELDATLKQLKQYLGTGGSREGRALQIQGDHRERLQPKLEAMGHRVKLAGG